MMVTTTDRSATDICNEYLQDLELARPQELDFELVRQIQRKHVTRHTFNNLSVLLQQDMPLESEYLFNKIVAQGRGGYCFEHNKLVFEVLAEIGFDVTILLARVVYNRDADVPRTHRITLLSFEGEKYIVDAGFGHYSARFPIKLEPGLVQDQGDNCYRIIKDERGEYGFQIIKDGEFFTLYSFDLARYNESDCQMSHFFSHKYPEAGFVNNLVVCQKYDDYTLSLRNGELHKMTQGVTEIETITSIDVFFDTMNRVFGLDVDKAVAEYLYNKFISPAT